MDKTKKSLPDGQKSRLKSQRKSTYSRRMSANQKERRRTQNINTAFAELRRCIPNVPQDTKLSKIRTLRLATSYISYLREVLQTERSRESNDKPPLSKTSRTISFHSNNRNYNAAIFSVKDEQNSERTCKKNDAGSWPYYCTWSAPDSSP